MQHLTALPTGYTIHDIRLPLHGGTSVCVLYLCKGLKEGDRFDMTNAVTYHAFSTTDVSDGCMRQARRKLSQAAFEHHDASADASAGK